MKQKLLLLTLLVAATMQIFAQAPQGLNYQAVVRNGSGQPVANNTPVVLKFSIHNATAGGTVVFTENVNVTANQFGLVSTTIGSSGNLATVNWGNGDKFLQVEANVNNGGFVDMGTTQLMSVPYALYAANSAAGPQGPQGVTGPQGQIGATGAQGIQGVTGAAGVTGANGVTGAIGNTGAQGIQGIQGVTGAQGIQGIAGVTGATGDTGPQGLQGVAGTAGAQGPQGIAGVTGATGDTGAQGIQGVAGTPGAQGTQGVAGATGVTGATGDTGAQGIQGIPGIQGVQGAQGLQGVTGATGATGLQGIQGTPGTPGSQGIQGAQGPQGNPGSQGPQGNVGVQGAQGIQGVAGAAGATGATGVTGIIQKYSVVGTASRTFVQSATLTAQPGLSQTFTTTALSTVWVWGSIGGFIPSSIDGDQTVVDIAIILDGNLLPTGGYNRFVVAYPGIGMGSVNTGFALAAGTHTIEIRTARSSGNWGVTIGGNGVTDVNPGELQIMVMY